MGEGRLAVYLIPSVNPLPTSRDGLGRGRRLEWQAASTRNLPGKERITVATSPCGTGDP